MPTTQSRSKTPATSTKTRVRSGAATAPRAPGKRQTDLSGETTQVVLKKAKSLIRVDFGGKKNGADVISQKMAALGYPVTSDQSEAIKKLMSDQVASCRKRIYPRIDEAIRRIDTPATRRRLSLQLSPEKRKLPGLFRIKNHMDNDQLKKIRQLLRPIIRVISTPGFDAGEENDHVRDRIFGMSEVVDAVFEEGGYEILRDEIVKAAGDLKVPIDPGLPIWDMLKLSNKVIDAYKRPPREYLQVDLHEFDRLQSLIIRIQKIVLVERIELPQPDVSSSIEYPLEIIWSHKRTNRMLAFYVEGSDVIARLRLGHVLKSPTHSYKNQTDKQIASIIDDFLMDIGTWLTTEHESISSVELSTR